MIIGIIYSDCFRAKERKGRVMNNNEINSLISGFLKKNGATAGNDKNRAKVEKMLGGLDNKQAEKLQGILNAPKKSQEILNSPAAKALMKKLMK